MAAGVFHSEIPSAVSAERSQAARNVRRSDLALSVFLVFCLAPFSLAAAFCVAVGASQIIVGFISAVAPLIRGH